MNLKDFQIKSYESILDSKRQKRIRDSFDKYHNAFEIGKLIYTNIDLAKKRASWLKEKTLRSLDKYLLEFESNFIQNGGKIIWAENANEACSAIENVLSDWNATIVLKSKSMLSEEIGLNSFLSTIGIKSIETDLGEFIQQIRSEAPFHMVTPAMHLSKEEISEQYSKTFQTDAFDSAEAITAFTRMHLRQFYQNGMVGITGANFLLADSGSIAVTENEGNAALCATMSKHIIIAGIERIIPSLNDLDLFWPILAVHGTGQKITRYNHIVSPEFKGERVLILVNNGRTDVLKEPLQRSALKCIRCGACHSVCPVFKTIGGLAYGNTLNGPIGKVVLPLQLGKENHFISNASTLCGHCKSTCPVEIDIPKMLLYNRNMAVKNNTNGLLSDYYWKFWRRIMLDPKYFDAIGTVGKKILLKILFKNSWGAQRELPVVAEKSFRQLMRDENK